MPQVIDINWIAALCGILGVGVSSILGIYGIWRSIDKRMNTFDTNQVKQTIVLENLVTEMIDLKGYEPRISKNETDIALINQRCNIIQEAKKEDHHETE